MKEVAEIVAADSGPSSRADGLFLGFFLPASYSG